MPDTLVIRKATLKDADSIATYLLLAMEDIVYAFLGEKNLVEAKNLLRYFTAKENNQYSYQNCWVAENEAGIVAAINVYDGAQLHALRQPVIERIQHMYKKDFTPEDETEAGEFYIDTLGVHPQHQGKGIGSKLLQFLINEYVNNRGETLGLLVDETNPNAKRLYIRLGFKTVGNKVLVGKPMEHLQIRAGKWSTIL